MEKQSLLANGGGDIEVKKNGYLYVYVSNASKGNVYFDDLSVVHTRGPLLEETHYYPFGLTMSGISSKALAVGVENRYRFGGKEKQEQEFSDDRGIDCYDFNARMYDPQIGRMWQIDPWVDKYERQSPYVGFNDNPIIFADPTGKGGELRAKQRDDGSWYIEVTATIYVYSNDESINTEDYARKIQEAINYQWNHPADLDENGNIVSEYSSQTTIGDEAADIVFNISVKAVTRDKAVELAEQNKKDKDPSINFMALSRDKSSEAKGNSGLFNIDEFNNSNGRSAAHELGHLFNYFVDKGFPTVYTPEDPTGQAAKYDNNNHADRSSPKESYWIMNRAHSAQIDPTKRRVNGEEYSRLNGGAGIRLPDRIRPIIIGTVTNEIFK